ncbi:hypothetical protein IFM89_017224 [Coptis chinensis]|uniref:Transposase MuDR plant domain-containing protein n=1 Tax=Coptis chinensis TaxID=261450 RepID=A0A835HDR8_9MAGN|nr:hypothetical protein IFM89_017224 [Coptis chinensis]
MFAIEPVLGMRFISKDEFKDCLRDYGVANGYPIKFIKNESNRVTAICGEGCEWRCHANPMQVECSWQIKSLNDLHECNRDFNAKFCNARWLSKKYKTQILANPRWKLENFVASVLHTYVINVSVNQCSRAKKFALGERDSVMIDHYAKAPSTAAPSTASPSAPTSTTTPSTTAPSNAPPSTAAAPPSKTKPKSKSKNYTVPIMTEPSNLVVASQSASSTPIGKQPKGKAVVLATSPTKNTRSSAAPTGTAPTETQALVAPGALKGKVVILTTCPAKNTRKATSTPAVILDSSPSKNTRSKKTLGIKPQGIVSILTFTLMECNGTRDVVNAHILAFEVPSAHGRYCVVDRVAHYSEIVKIFYPYIQLPEKCVDDNPFAPTYNVSEEKTERFTPLEVSLKDIIESSKEKKLISF